MKYEIVMMVAKVVDLGTACQRKVEGEKE